MNLGLLGAAADGTYGSEVTYAQPGLATGSMDGGGIGLIENVNSNVLLNSYSMPSTDVSVSFWLNGADGIGLTHFFGYAVPGSNNEFTFGADGNQFRAIVNGDIEDFNGVDVMDGMNHHIGLSYQSDTGNLLVYVDGSLEINHNFSATPLDGSGVLALGQDFDSTNPPYGFEAGQAFLGTLDEFAIFDRVLNASEFNQHASAIPEPGSAAFSVLTLACLAQIRRRE
jgi:CUB/sushi domain-containing protein